MCDMLHVNKDIYCVMCKVLEESFEHFMNCKAYGKSSIETNLTEIFENDVYQQNIIARDIQRRQRQTQENETTRGRPASLTGSPAPDRPVVVEL